MTESPIELPEAALKAWSQAVLRYTKQAKTLPEAIRLSQKAVFSIWQTYTQGRGQIGRLAATKAEFVGPYLIGFHLPNVARFLAVWGRALTRGLQMPATLARVRIVDLGCGSGSASQAMAIAFGSSQAHLTFELLDRSRHLIEAAELMLSRQLPKARIWSQGSALERLKLPGLIGKWRKFPSDLNIICLGYVWNELSANPKARLWMRSCLDFWRNCDQPSCLLVCEPAAEENARQTMAWREELVQQGWYVFYPCPLSGRCPMLRSDRDWCYSELRMQKIAPLEEVERRLHISREIMGTSGYLFLNSAAQRLFKPAAGKRVVVGHPVDEGRASVLLCSGREIEKLKSGPHDRPLKGSIFDY